MKQRYLAAVLALSFMVLTAASNGSAQTAAPSGNSQSFFDEITWIADGGLSLPTGDAGDAANLGFCIGFNGFYHYNEFLLIGMRVAYNRWGANEEQWESGGYAADVDGHWSSFEVVPQVRYLIMPDETRPVNFFGQAGLGIYRIATDVKIDFKSGPISSISVEKDNFELGLCLGGGITMEKGKFTYEIKPMYHIVFTEGDSFTYFAVTGGILF